VFLLRLFGSEMVGENQFFFRIVPGSRARRMKRSLFQCYVGDK
jgi:hypothetical protein